MKSCKYCGCIHDINYKCRSIPTKTYKETLATKFRRTSKWIKKSIEIRQRDNYLCQWCLTKGLYTYDRLSVHHIIPIVVNYKKSLDNDNLITLCAECHHNAEVGKIKVEVLIKLIPPY